MSRPTTSSEPKVERTAGVTPKPEEGRGGDVDDDVDDDVDADDDRHRRRRRSKGEGRRQEQRAARRPPRGVHGRALWRVHCSCITAFILLRGQEETLRHKGTRSQQVCVKRQVMVGPYHARDQQLERHLQRVLVPRSIEGRKYFALRHDADWYLTCGVDETRETDGQDGRLVVGDDCEELDDLGRRRDEAGESREQERRAGEVGGSQRKH